MGTGGEGIKGKDTAQMKEFSLGRQDRSYKPRKIRVLSLKIKNSRTTEDLDKCGIGIYYKCFFISIGLSKPTSVYRRKKKCQADFSSDRFNSNFCL
jgi:hypothetical protein